MQLTFNMCMTKHTTNTTHKTTSHTLILLFYKSYNTHTKETNCIQQLQTHIKTHKIITPAHIKRYLTHTYIDTVTTYLIIRKITSTFNIRSITDQSTVSHSSPTQNKSPSLLSYIHKVDASYNLSTLCPHTQEHHTTHLFICTHKNITPHTSLFAHMYPHSYTTIRCLEGQFSR